MASPKQTDADTGDSKFPAANVDLELNPGKNKNFEEDSGPSLVATSKEIKEQIEAEDKKKKDQEKKDAIQTLKKSVIVSAVIVALAGAIFAITKKLREK
ncbi:unnamed protein product [Prunus armeniaca]|uniref:Uncharacterized protein n=2 Tax=Prunus TaxID=3754 RepID=A0A6J5Y0R6_PRUAR|nr:PREDICTED: uncharacterized protein LOC103341766 [Prunus mume]KAH0971673.1 hypothetical protein GBA52_023829 [Prunus armeniaca]CAB4287143.1 unnamed protein product [Prunus armeniaca]CAB4317515.1 unnamed protein product [Prunus armeniaca]